MPGFTREQLSQMLAAIKSNNLVELDKVMLIQGIYSRSNLKQYDLCFKVACHFGLTTAVAKYLELRSYSDEVLSIGLFEACKNGDIDTLKVLIEKGHADPNKNFDIAACHTDDIANPAINFDLRKDKEKQPEVFPLFYATLCQRIEIVRYLAGLRNINLNKTFRYDNAVNKTVLLFTFKRPEIAKILLENGANPLIECEALQTKEQLEKDLVTKEQLLTKEQLKKAGLDQDHILTYSFYSYIARKVADEDVHDPLVKMYFEEWYPKNKHREHELNTEAARIAGKYYSSEHSSGSGSNSPMSLTPNGSPPHPSVMVRHSPPDSPEGLRNGSPVGSPMQRSDSASSGSAGSSPERVSVQPVVSPQFIIPSGDGDLDDEFYSALCSRNKFEQAKTIYDTGRVRFNSSFKDDNKLKNVLQIAMTSRIYDWFSDLEKYMLCHPKYPADINSVNSNRQTVLHLRMHIGTNIKSIPGRAGVTAVMEKYADKNPNINAIDKMENTPLHYAAGSGSTKSHEAVDELLKRGADASLRNKEGLTAEEYCKRYCPDEEAKKKVLAVFATHRPQQQSIANLVTSSSTPIIYSGANSAGAPSSQKNATNNSGAAIPTAVAAQNVRGNSNTVGSMYAIPPAASVELPKRPQNQDTHNKEDKKKASLGGMVKNLFHIK